mmetsp:Transcript_84168/g.228514  ORF Transcript_84168/g.228514 Transcript_84168/m.228514 type:complete len:665 (-) Transcript_84168:129-2123(-)
MKMSITAVLGALAVLPGSLALTLSASSKVTPTQQVINMMSELKAKGEKMVEEEQKTYATYAEWVDDESKRLGFEIQDGEAKIEALVAYITKAESDATELGHAVEKLDAEIMQLTTEKKEATEIRNEQHDEYLKISKDYGESVDALQRAIQVMSAENYDRAQAVVLLQRMSTTVPGMEPVLAALQQQQQTSEPGAPEVAAYEFQAGGIVELLNSLLDKFSGELADVESAELNQAHEFNLVELHLTNTIEKDTSDRDEKSQAKSEKLAASAKAQGELSETKAAKADDEALKQEIETTFAVKKATYEQNQVVRADELMAISNALEIISSPEVAGSYKEHINFLQVQKSVSLLQTGSSMRAARDQAMSLLRRRAKALGSESLMSLAAAVAAQAPAFTKIIDMIETLLDKLKEEAAAEADHKAWCDEQLKANKLKRNKKTAKVDELNAKIEGLSADIFEMGATMAKLSEEQAALTKAMAEATEMREKEKAENLDTIADSAAGADAVKRAIVVLKEFYSSQQAAFLQQKQVPEMAAYKGMQSSKGGVIGMLEVIETDFLRLQAETEASESAAATEYAEFMSASTASKKLKHEAEFKLKLEKDQAEFEKEETTKDLRATEEELAKANVYFEYLKPSCIEVHVSWEERVAKRKEEVAALKEAYAILDEKSKA